MVRRVSFLNSCFPIYDPKLMMLLTTGIRDLCDDDSLLRCLSWRRSLHQTSLRSAVDLSMNCGMLGRGHNGAPLRYTSTHTVNCYRQN